MGALPRLATYMWVGALMRRAEAAGAFATVLRKGDPVAGAVILIARARDGRMTAWSRAIHGDKAVWTIAQEAGPDETTRIDRWLDRQAGYDPDMWSIELVTEEIQPFVAETSHTV